MNEDDDRGDDERTFETIRQIGNSVNPMIQLTVDYPSKHANGRFPILDLEVWIVRTEDGFQEIRYSFYEKPMKSEYVLMQRSAVPMATKRAALVNETVRRLGNCHESVEEAEVAEVLSRFCQKMKTSGYGEKFRRQVIDAGVKVHREQIRVEAAGGRKMFRTRDVARRKKNNKSSWWRKPNGSGRIPVTIIKVPYTHKPGLKREMERITRESGITAKFIETSGYSLQNVLEKSDPFRGPDCGRLPKCFSCQSGGKGDCEGRGGAYAIFCEEPECVDKKVRYDGETGKSCFSRGLDHLQGYRSRSPGNVLWKHACNDHGGRTDVKFKMTVLKTYGDKNLLRKLNEAVRITNNPGVKLNSKAEFAQPSLPRLVINSGRNM